VAEEILPDSKALVYAMGLLEDLSEQAADTDDPLLIAATAQASALVAICQTLDLILYKIAVVPD